jgi:hypothetical protein
MVNNKGINIVRNDILINKPIISSDPFRVKAKIKARFASTIKKIISFPVSIELRTRVFTSSKNLIIKLFNLECRIRLNFYTQS